jgi:hypothetical protein
MPSTAASHRTSRAISTASARWFWFEDKLR